MVSRATISRPAANDGIFSRYKVGFVSLLHTSVRIVFLRRSVLFGRVGPRFYRSDASCFCFAFKKKTKKRKRDMLSDRPAL